MILPNSSEMKDLEQIAIKKFGIPSIVLMENAGVGTVHMMEQELGSPDNTFSVILVGPGNNGGDGLVIGRHLHQRGCQPFFFFLVNPDELKGDAAVNLNIIRALKLPFHVIDTEARVQTIPVLFKQIESRGLPCYAIIDALFGIGLSREITGHYADAIDLFNKSDFISSTPIVAVDGPSGMNSDTGRIYGKCLKATHTATYGYAKAGQVVHCNTRLTGKLHIIDIGIPPETAHQKHIPTQLLTREFASPILSSLERQIQSHKGSHGHCLVLAGSKGKTGAAILAARSAIRSGSGLVSLCVPDNLNGIFEISLPEAMTIPLPASSSHLNIDDLKVIEQNVDGKNVVILGPGLGTAKPTAELVIHLYQSIKIPMVIDADAITILAQHKQQLKPPAGPRIFTPHPGELSRILDVSTEEINNNRVESAIKGCQVFQNDQHESILILKGSATVITSDRENIVINTSGNPGMAAGGMGDVLAGTIGAFIAQGLSCHQATCGAVYIHGNAGDRLFKKFGQGFTASELADMIPCCIKRIVEV